MSKIAPRIRWLIGLMGFSPLLATGLLWSLGIPVESCRTLLTVLNAIGLGTAFLLLGVPRLAQLQPSRNSSQESTELVETLTQSAVFLRAHAHGQLQAILDYADVGIVTLSHQYTIDMLNAKAKNLLGCTSEAVYGRSCDQFFLQLEGGTSSTSPTNYVGLSKHLRIPSDPRPSGTDLPAHVAVRLDGRRFPIELSTSVWEYQGRLNVTLIFRDITDRTEREAKLRRLLDERKRLNEELTKRVHERTVDLEKANQQLAQSLEQAHTETRARDMFLATVSHELRTPLTHIQGFAQFLELSGLDQQQREDLGRVRSAANHLLDLVNDILDYQRTLLNRVELKKELFDACVTLRELAEMYQGRIAERNNIFEVTLPDRPCFLYNDKRRFKQVLNNLLHNAAKFSSDSTVYLHAWTERPDRTLRVVVRDTGPGISDEQQTRIWEPFKNRNRQLSAAGTGLGLPITKSLLELMGGSIILSSHVGRGTRFEIVLPLAREEGSVSDVALEKLLAEDDPSRKPASGSAKSSSEMTLEVDLQAVRPSWSVTEKMRYAPACILIVSTDEPSLQTLSTVLGPRQVHLATAGQQAVELLQQLTPEAIIMDLGSSPPGATAFLSFLKTDHGARRLPLLMVTTRPLGMEEIQRLKGGSLRILLSSGGSLAANASRIGQEIDALLTQESEVDSV